jgi:hypothetical protein
MDHASNPQARGTPLGEQDEEGKPSLHCSFDIVKNYPNIMIIIVLV